MNLLNTASSQGLIDSGSPIQLVLVGFLLMMGSLVTYVVYAVSGRGEGCLSVLFGAATLIMAIGGVICLSSGLFGK